MIINKFKKIILSVAIALLTVFFVNQGIEVFYPGPESCDYLPEYPPKECGELQNGSPEKECGEGEAFVYNLSDCTGYCDSCQSEYEEKSEKRDRYVFIFLVVLSAGFLMAGMLLKAESVGNGLLIASVVQLIIVSFSYGSGAEELQRFLLIGAVLAVLVFVGYKKVK